MNGRNLFSYILRMGLFLIIGIFGGILCLTAVYKLPVSRMERNIKSSMAVFYTESVYPQQVAGYKTTQLDNETDAIMILNAIYDGTGESAVSRAMRVERIAFSNIPSHCNALIKYAWENQIPDTTVEYSRYWHGYLVWLKPLLLLLDYADIRVLNMLLQVLLVVWLVREMIRYGETRYLFPLGLAIAVVNPSAVSMSLQFSCIYYISLLSMILVLHYHKRWSEKGYYPYFFFILGMLTVYFDFLTYPTAALGMPLILVLTLDQKSWKEGVKIVILSGFCFSLGYIGMWAGKWLAGSLILGENVFHSALEQLFVHTGDAVIDGKSISHVDVIFRNLRVLMRWPYLMVFGAFFLWYILCLFKNGISLKRIGDGLPLLGVAVIPFVWFLLTSSHAAWCYWYTYRGFMVTVFGGFCFLAFLNRSEKRQRLE